MRLAREKLFVKPLSPALRIGRSDPADDFGGDQAERGADRDRHAEHERPEDPVAQPDQVAHSVSSLRIAMPSTKVQNIQRYSQA